MRGRAEIGSLVVKIHPTVIVCYLFLYVHWPLLYFISYFGHVVPYILTLVHPMKNY